MQGALSTILRFLKRMVITTLAGILLLVLFVGSWVAITMPLTSAEQAKHKQAVGEQIPPDFPYLVLTRTADGKHEPWITLQRELEEFQHKHPGYTFLVPAAEEQRLSDEILRRNQSRSGRSPDETRFWLSAFEIENRWDGRQEIRVTARFDDDDQNIGWYEATDKQAIPRYHQAYFGPGAVLGSLGLGLILNVALWTVGGAVIWLLRRRRRNRRFDTPT